MNLFEKFQLGLNYTAFLERYATDDQKRRWDDVQARVALTLPQRELLAAFRREMNVLCLAGAWCGDCIQQCPVFEHFAAAAPVIRVRYLDRDEHGDVQEKLRLNGGRRVPVVVFLSEDGWEVSRYGDRTLSAYRRMMQSALAAECPGSWPPSGESVLALATQEWLNEFERAQWMLRLSPRLRQRHAD